MNIHPLLMNSSWTEMRACSGYCLGVEKETDFPKAHPLLHVCDAERDLECQKPGLTRKRPSINLQKIKINLKLLFSLFPIFYQNFGCLKNYLSRPISGIQKSEIFLFFYCD